MRHGRSNRNNRPPRYKRKKPGQARIAATITFQTPTNQRNKDRRPS